AFLQLELDLQLFGREARGRPKVSGVSLERRQICRGRHRRAVRAGAGRIVVVERHGGDGRIEKVVVFLSQLFADETVYRYARRSERDVCHGASGQKGPSAAVESFGRTLEVRQPREDRKLVLVTRKWLEKSGHVEVTGRPHRSLEHQ